MYNLVFQGVTFRVPAGDLAFSVVIYTATAFVCITVLILRRYLPAFGKGELGGNKGLKIFCAVLLIFMRIFYILMSSLQAYGHISGF